MSDPLPLPMAPFEQYMLEDDRPEYPMTFVLEMTLRGEGRRDIFDRALAVVLPRHPLLQSVVRRRWFRKPLWVSAPDPQPHVDWGAWEKPIDCEDEYLDLTQEVGVRFWVRVGDHRTRVVVQFHHCCCDAHGGLLFLTDLVTAYANSLPGVEDGRYRLNDVDVQQLHRRDDLSTHLWEPEKRWDFIRRTVMHTLRVLGRPAAPLAIPDRRPLGQRCTPLDFPGNLTQTLDVSVYRRLRKLARRNSSTVNDLLLRELFLTMREWNTQVTTKKTGRWYSIAIPTNLRSIEQDRLPAANVLSYWFSIRGVSEMDDPEQLLKTIRDENEFVKRGRYTTVFLDMMRMVQRVPGALRLACLKQKCMSSVVLSYVGNPTRVLTERVPINELGEPAFGNLALIDVNAAPPVRPKTRASFTVWHFEEKMRVGLRCDPYHFTTEDAGMLLGMYVDRIEALVENMDTGKSDRTAAA
ncbi:MAG: hypothetical protein ACF8TS_04135 [Maioricimonas sp. JB049]